MIFKFFVSVIWIFVATFPNYLCNLTGSTLPPILIDSSNKSGTTFPPTSVSEPFEFSEEPLVFQPSDFTRTLGTFTVSAVPAGVGPPSGNSPSSRSLDSKVKDQVFCRYEYYRIPLSNEPKRRVSVDDQFFKIKGSKVIYRVTAKFNDSVAQQFGKGKFSEDFSTLDEIAAGGDSMGASSPTPFDFPKTVAKVLNSQRILSLKKSPDSYESFNAKKLSQRGIEQVIECYDEDVGPTSVESKLEINAAHGEKLEEEPTSRKYETRRRQEDERREIENMRRERDRRKDREEALWRQEEDERRNFEDRLRARHEDERSDDYEDRLQAREEKRRTEENNKSRHQERNNHHRNYNKNRPMEDSQWGGGTKQNIRVDKQAQDSRKHLDEFTKLKSEMEHDSVQDSKKRFDEPKQVQSEKREQNPGQDRRKFSDEFKKLQSEMDQDSVQDSKKLLDSFKNGKSETQQYSDQDRKRLLAEFKKAQSETVQDNVEFQRRQTGNLAETPSGNRNVAKKEPVQQGKGVQDDGNKRRLEIELVLAQYNVPANSSR